MEEIIPIRGTFQSLGHRSRICEKKLNLCKKIELSTSKEVMDPSPSDMSENYNTSDETSSPAEPSLRSPPSGTQNTETVG